MKQSYLSLAVFFFIAVLLNSCGGFNCIPGEGDVITKQIDLNLFEAIEIDHAIDVELSYGQNQIVEVTGHENHLALLNKEISSKKWVIDFQENVCSTDLKIHITLPELKRIDIDGSGNVTGLTPFHTKDFAGTIDGSGNLSIHINAEDVDISVSGSGNVDLAGYTDELDIEVRGSGDISAYRLEAKRVDINTKGSGNIEVTAKESLHADLTGSGNVRYDGGPGKLSTDVTGSGTVEKK